MHRQQFARNIAFFGEEGQKQIENAHIAIVGLGGVGSHAAHMLARSGVGNFSFFDFDVVTVSSLNRHSVAVRKDIGKPKVEVMRDHILEFNPMVNITVQRVLVSKDNLPSLIDSSCDFVVDCIDDYSSKADLLEYCIRNNIKVISSMGSGCRSNPTSLLFTNITDVKCKSSSVTHHSRRSPSREDSPHTKKARHRLRFERVFQPNHRDGFHESHDREHIVRCFHSVRVFLREASGFHHVLWGKQAGEDAGERHDDRSCAAIQLGRTQSGGSDRCTELFDDALSHDSGVWWGVRIVGDGCRMCSSRFWERNLLVYSALTVS